MQKYICFSCSSTGKKNLSQHYFKSYLHGSVKSYTSFDNQELPAIFGKCGLKSAPTVMGRFFFFGGGDGMGKICVPMQLSNLLLRKIYVKLNTVKRTINCYSYQDAMVNNF